MIIIRALNKYYSTKAVQAVFTALRATIIGLILTAAFNIASITLFDLNLFSSDLLNAFNYKAILIFVVLLYGFTRYKKHPLLYIGAGALMGLIFLSI
jgi:chromate transporter